MLVIEGLTKGGGGLSCDSSLRERKKERNEPKRACHKRVSCLSIEINSAVIPRHTYFRHVVRRLGTLQPLNAALRPHAPKVRAWAQFNAKATSGDDTVALIATRLVLPPLPFCRLQVLGEALPMPHAPLEYKYYYSYGYKSTDGLLACLPGCYSSPPAPAH